MIRSFDNPSPFYLTWVSLLPTLAAVFWALQPLVVAGTGSVPDPIDTARFLDFREVIREAKERVFPALVYIKVVQGSHRSGKRDLGEAAGSGVLISPDGEILTNWHVVDKAVEVRCLLQDGRAFPAEIIGKDKGIDLALLRIGGLENQSLPYASLGDSTQLQEGEFVMAMGAPWGLSRSVSIGIISCTRRFLPQASEYSLWLQTDAAISPGNSGGPLVNTEGKIIGINSRGIMIGGDLGFAIPSATIREILPRLRQHGDVQWSWTGLHLQPLRDFEKNLYFEGDQGVLVSGIDPDSPASQAGFHQGDRILNMQDQELNGVTGEDLPIIRRALALLPVDRPVPFQIQRGEEELVLVLTPRTKGELEGAELDCPKWDLTVKSINQFDNPQLFFFRKQGVFIFGIQTPGNAMNSGLRRGDIILEIGGKPVLGLDDVQAIYDKSVSEDSPKHRLFFSILRNGLMKQLILDFSRNYDPE